MSKWIRALSVIVVLVLIAAVAVRQVDHRRDNAAYQVSVRELYEVAKAMEKHYLTKGKYPVFDNWEEVVAWDSPLREFLDEDEDFPENDSLGREYRIETSTEKEYRFEGFDSEGSSNRHRPDFAYETKLKKTTAETAKN
jgi:hypothetical protein